MKQAKNETLTFSQTVFFLAIPSLYTTAYWMRTLSGDVDLESRVLAALLKTCKLGILGMQI